MKEFRPLSKRDESDRRFDELHDGLPDHLIEPVLSWFKQFLWGTAPMGEVWVESEFVRLVQLRLQLSLDWSHDERAVDDLLGRMRDDRELALDAIEITLRQLAVHGDGALEYNTLRVASLNSILEAGRSIWEAVLSEDGPPWHLARRALGPVHDAIEALSGSTRAQRHLAVAWHRLAGRDPDPSGAHREAVRAVESIAKSIVTPHDDRATLGKIIRAIRDKPAKWTFPLGGSEAVLSLLDLLWTGQHDRHGTDDPNAPFEVSQAQAEAALPLAVTLCTFFATGLFAVVPADDGASEGGGPSARAVAPSDTRPRPPPGGLVLLAMVDESVVAVLGSTGLVYKLLGPTVEYLGVGLRDWTERRAENVQRVFERAEAKLGPGELERPWRVPPRVLKGVLEEGQFAEDALAAEYLGGVLASARTESGRDDRGATQTALIGRLSTYQLRTHYLVYANARRFMRGNLVNLGESSVRDQTRFYVPVDDYVDGMGFDERERLGANLDALVVHALVGLGRESLLDPYAYGHPSDLQRIGGARDFGDQGLLVGLTVPGVELFLAAHGMRGPHTDFVRSSSTVLDGQPVLGPLPRFVPVSDVPLRGASGEGSSAARGGV